VNDDDEQRRTKIYALNRIRTYGLGIQAIKGYASDRAAIETAAKYTIFNTYC
jgi:hypothetical protein